MKSRRTLLHTILSIITNLISPTVAIYRRKISLFTSSIGTRAQLEVAEPVVADQVAALRHGLVATQHAVDGAQ